MRRRDHAGDDLRTVGAGGCRSSNPGGAPHYPSSTHGPGQALHLPRVRTSGGLVRRPPREALGRRRADGPLEPDPPVPSAPPIDAWDWRFPSGDGRRPSQVLQERWNGTGGPGPTCCRNAELRRRQSKERGDVSGPGSAVPGAGGGSKSVVVPPGSPAATVAPSPGISSGAGGSRRGLRQ